MGANIEGLQPPVAVVGTSSTSTTAAATTTSGTSPAVSDLGCSGLNHFALLPASALGESVATATTSGPTTAASVMETKCTQTKLEDKELADFIPPNPATLSATTSGDPTSVGGKAHAATSAAVGIADTREGDAGEAAVVVDSGKDVTGNESSKSAEAVTSTAAAGWATTEGSGPNTAGQQPSTSEAVIGAESKGELGSWTRSTTEVCPWEDDDNRKESHAPFVKTYATLGYL